MNVYAASVCRVPSSSASAAYVEVRPVDVRAALSEIQLCRSVVSLHDILLEGKHPAASTADDDSSL